MIYGEKSGLVWNYPLTIPEGNITKYDTILHLFLEHTHTKEHINGVETCQVHVTLYCADRYYKVYSINTCSYNSVKEEHITGLKDFTNWPIFDRKTWNNTVYQNNWRLAEIQYFCVINTFFHYLQTEDMY